MKKRSNYYIRLLDNGFSSMEIKSTYENVKGAVIDYYYDEDNVKVNVDGELGERYGRFWIIIRGYNESGKIFFEAEK